MRAGITQSVIDGIRYIDCWDSIPGRGKNFLYSAVTRPDSGNHPASYAMGIGGSSVEA
jgi:hypothetical protein